ncbi:hypothetical protein SCOR_01830 [Sulfidibacter corallicola]
MFVLWEKPPCFAWLRVWLLPARAPEVAFFCVIYLY